MLDHKPLGICPACGETVKDSDDAVWTCPYDLNPANPYWQPSPLTANQRAELEADGYYGLCLMGTGRGYCDDMHMPLHVACYERGDY